MNDKVIKWLKRIAILGILFFLIKGLILIAVVLGVGSYIHSILP